MATRVGLIANVVALAATLRAYNEPGVDWVVFLGDAVVPGPRPKEVLKLLL